MEAASGKIFRKIHAMTILLSVAVALVPVVVMSFFYAFIPYQALVAAKGDGGAPGGVLTEMMLTAAFAAVSTGAFTGFLLARRAGAPLKLLMEAGKKLSAAVSAADPEAGRSVGEDPAGIGDMTGSMAKAADRLSSINNYAGLISSSMSDALAIVGADGRIKTANRSFLDLLGYTAQEAREKSFEDVCADAALLPKPGPGDAASAVQCFYTSSGGGKIPVSVSVYPFDGNGAAGRVITLARDLREVTSLREELATTRTELTNRVENLEEFREGVLRMLRNIDASEKDLKEAYDRLRETQAQLVQSTKLRALGELAAALAHELNQPLTVIRGISQHLIKKAGPVSSDREKLDIIENATRKMEKVVNHLRTFSRQDEPATKPLDLNRVIEDAFIITNELLKNHSIKVAFDLSPLPPIRGDANKLEQVVINIVTNARDAMPGGGVLAISTGLTDDGGKKCVFASFRDSGHGIAPDIIDRVFEPFFTTKDIDKGTGLGLSISYGIIKDHGGRIEVKSELGKGTAFRIIIPATQ